jgi:hypothetical protein
MEIRRLETQGHPVLSSVGVWWKSAQFRGQRGGSLTVHEGKILLISTLRAVCVGWPLQVEGLFHEILFSTMIELGKESAQVRFRAVTQTTVRTCAAVSSDSTEQANRSPLLLDRGSRLVRRMERRATVTPPSPPSY